MFYDTSIFPLCPLSTFNIRHILGSVVCVVLHASCFGVGQVIRFVFAYHTRSLSFSATCGRLRSQIHDCIKSGLVNCLGTLSPSPSRSSPARNLPLYRPPSMTGSPILRRPSSMRPACVLRLTDSVPSALAACPALRMRAY